VVFKCFILILKVVVICASHNWSCNFCLQLPWIRYNPLNCLFNNFAKVSKMFYCHDLKHN
jgi:hypothetical protein